MSAEGNRGTRPLWTWQHFTWARRVLKGIGMVIALAALGYSVLLIGLKIAFVTHTHQVLTSAIALGDLDGDGDLDAFLANRTHELTAPDTVWLNQGGKQGGRPGTFSDSGQQLGDRHSTAVALSDLDGDGDVDVMVGGWGVNYYANDGSAQLWGPLYLGRLLADGADIRPTPALGDLDGDGDLDAFLGGCCGTAHRSPGGSQSGRWTYLPPHSTVWFNDGFKGSIVILSDQPEQRLGDSPIMDVALGDVDGDGDLDAFLVTTGFLPEGKARRAEPDLVWLNDGTGRFRDSGQRLSEAAGQAIALGDLDGDGDPDAVVGNRGPDEVWLNDGRGTFSDSGQRLGRDLTRSIFLADLDGDGDLDLFVGSETSGRAWFNDGTGRFSSGRQLIRYGRHQAISLGDVTGDDLPDMFVADIDSYRVWRAEGNGRFTADKRAD